MDVEEIGFFVALGLTPGDLVTVHEAAAMLHINVQAAYALIRDGKLKAVLIGKRRGIRIDRESLTNFQKIYL